MKLWRTMPRPAPDAARNWISEDQWRQAVDRVQHAPTDAAPPPILDRRDPNNERRPLIRRCLLRVERRGQVLGMLVVRTHNLSQSGMCVIHAGRVPRYARAVVLIEGAQGGGLIVAGSIAWCKRARGLHPLAHKIGIEFDKPIDISRFVEENP